MKQLKYLLLLSIFSFGLTNLVNAQCGNPLVSPSFAFNNGQSGIMFAINAKKNIVIDSFDLNMDAGTYGYQIYYRPGTFIGFDLSPAGWTLVGSGTVTSTGGPTNLPASLNILLTTYSTGSFYLTSTTGTSTNYTTGLSTTAACDSLNGNSDMTLTVGYGKAYPFGVTFQPRYFSGRVYYHCLSTTPNSVIDNPPVCNPTTGMTFPAYLDPPVNGANFTWTLPTGVSLVGSGNNDSITLQVTGTITGNICVDISNCGMTTQTVCNPLNTSPAVIDAGPDTAICGSAYTMLPNATFGSWALVSGSGSITNPNQFNTSVTNLGQGDNVFKFVSAPPGCPADSDTVVVTVSPIPIAQFTPPTGCDGSIIVGTDQSYALGGSIINRDWDVDGDGTIDYSGTQFYHTYPGPGTYNCKLVVTANGGCKDSVIQQVIVHPNPQAVINHAPDCEGAYTNFSDGSIIASGSITGWTWTFGDYSLPSNQQNPNHLYDSAGFYVVTLLAESSFGCTGAAADTIEVFSVPEPIFFWEDTCADVSFNFVDSSVSTQGVINWWSWDYGDGSPAVVSQNSSHKFPTHATYNVRLTVATNKGCTAYVENPVKAYPVPVPDFSTLEECEKQPMTFEDESYVNNMFGSFINQWKWEYGDGDSAFVQNSNHFYQAPGYYDATFTVTTNLGCDTHITKELLLRPKPQAEFLVTGDKSCAGTKLDFTNETFFDYTYDSKGVTDYTWYFGDQTKKKSESPQHIYATGGMYKVQFIVETDYGCIDSTSQMIEVYHNPIAKYDIDTLQRCSPHCAVFIDQSKLAGEDELFHRWVFGQGSISNEANPTFCYELEDGDGSEYYFTRLEVTTEHNCKDTFFYEDPVVVHANPIADFEIEIDEIELLDPVVYVNNTSVGGQYFTWNFGDSSEVYTMQPFQHTYDSPGTYTISLFTESGTGCKDQVSKDVRVIAHESFFIPTAFTPNGDGKNERFEIKGEGLEYVRLWIFDRWGTELYYAEDEAISWDGTYDGKLMPLGAYAYVVEYKFVGQTPEKKSGSFNITETKEN